MKQIDEFIKEINTKPTWGNKDLIAKLIAVGQSIDDQLKNEGKILNPTMPKMVAVTVIKKYDVIYVSLMGGIPHYMLVDRVKDGLVYGLTFSSKDKPQYSLSPVFKDRFFEGSFITTTYASIPEEEAKEKFIRVYENKIEADTFFRKVRNYYKEVLGLK